MNYDDSHMKNIGYLYIMEIDGCPGLLKIGMTKISPYLRAEQLSSQCAAIGEFNVRYYVGVPNVHIAENILHDTFHKFRKRKEYFMVDVVLVKRCAASISKSLWAARKRTAQSDIDHLEIEALQLYLDLQLLKF
jgi:hypothetical protein